MYTMNDIKVELLNPEEVKNFIKNHGPPESFSRCKCNKKIRINKILEPNLQHNGIQSKRDSGDTGRYC